MNLNLPYKIDVFENRLYILMHNPCGVISLPKFGESSLKSGDTDSVLIIENCTTPIDDLLLIQQYKQNVNYQKGLVDSFQTVWQIFYICICMKSVVNVVKRGDWGGLDIWSIRVWMIGWRSVEMWWWQGWNVWAGVRCVGRGRKTLGKLLTLA